MGNTMKKRKNISEHELALFKIKCVRDTIKVYQRRISKAINDEQDLTVNLLKSGQRDKAKSLLRKKLALTKYLQNADGQLEVLESIIYQIEATFLDRKVCEVLQLGSETLKKINEVLSIQDVQNIMAKTAEGIRKQMEVEEKIAFLQITVDEACLEEELEKIEQGTHNTGENVEQMACRNVSRKSNVNLDTLRRKNKNEGLNPVAGPSRVKKRSKAKKSEQEAKLKEKPLVIEM